MLTPDRKVTEVMPPDALLQEFSHFLSVQMGLCFSRDRWPDLLRGMAPLAREQDASSLEHCMRQLMVSPLSKYTVERLANYLSVGETYFFRDGGVFSALENSVLPQLIASRCASGQKKLRLWSAGCCTGEETYSLAILISRLIPDLSAWDILVVGTDINPNFLQKAITGVYRDWSFRNVPAWVKQGYFEMQEPGNYAIRSSIKRLVAFNYLNLADDIYPAFVNQASAMDVVFCRHVLMYFDTVQIKKAAQKFHRVLTEDGWLAVGTAETNPQLFPGFKAINLSDAFFYRKDGVSTLPPSTNLQWPSFLELLPEAEIFGEVSLFADVESAVEVRVESRLPADFEPPSDFSPSPYEQARVFANQGKLAEADDLCALAIEADKCNPEPRYLRAVIFQERGEFEHAIRSLKQVIYLDPDFIFAYIALGNLLRHQKNITDAEKYFACAIELLQKHLPDAILPGSEGMTVEQLIGMIRGKEDLV